MERDPAQSSSMPSSEIVFFTSSKPASLHKYSFDDIVSATNNFAKDNLIKRGDFSDVYKGKLLCSNERIDVVIRRYLSSLVLSEFLREIQEHSDLIHRNVLPIVGFCYENHEKIMVFEYLQNRSLKKYISDPTALTWSQRLNICLGAASFLTYIHDDIEVRGRDHKIKSSRILLDKDWEAKVFCLGFHNGSQGIGIPYSKSSYTDPQNNRSHVSDVYAFGVILFEVICGKKAEVSERGAYQSFARMAKHHYEEGELDEIIHPDLKKQMHPLSLSIVSKIAYDCLHEEGKKRPRMNLIVEGLQQALFLPLTKENVVLNMKHLEIQLDVILSATNNFDETYCIGTGAYGNVYKAELPYENDRASSSASEIINEDKLPWNLTLAIRRIMHIDKLPRNHTIAKKGIMHRDQLLRNRTVAIKRIMHREDELGNKGFAAELELLNDCKNPNILRLLGFCVTGSERVLVYEHASNGSLDDYLNSPYKMIDLTWDQRLKMCLGIAYGLNYLHKTEGRKRSIIHRDIKSDNILLDENLNVKIADFGLSIFHPTNHPESTILTNNFAGTDVYADPEYRKTGKLKVESDIYSFGVVLFEILSGKSAYDSIYTSQYEKGLAPVAREHFSKGTIMELVDATLMNEAHELSSTLKIGPDKHSLDAFCKVACECLAETQVRRPKMEVIIEELEKALHFQENRKDTLEISLEDIRFDGETFSDNNYNISKDLGMVYNGEVQYDSGCKAVTIKQLRRSGLEPGIWREFEIPFKHRHENVISLVGYCKKMDERFIVYEHHPNQSLDLHLENAELSWTKRLKICIDIAIGLSFLHKCDAGPEVVIHRDMKSSNILLTEDWIAKISGFEYSLLFPKNQEISYVVNPLKQCSPGYRDPLYRENRFLTKESDIYSFGVILFEVLFGRLACHLDSKGSTQFLVDLVKHHHRVGTLEDIVFDGIKKQIVHKSLVTFHRIAIQCLHDDITERPTAGAVLEQLQNALEIQEAFEIWKNKLPLNYIEILKLSNSPKKYSSMGEKDIYNMFSKGISLQDGILWFSIGRNEERNEMISATTFSYKNRRLLRWKSIEISRFRKVAKVLDVANLNIQIRKSTQLLVPGVNYSVHLVFKFCGPRKSNADRMYVNLKYKIGKQNLHAYFATWRKDGWMMIELCRLSNQTEEPHINVLLESFSQCYCHSCAIYIEGVEFQALDNVKQEEIMNLENTQQVSNSEMDKSSSSIKTEVPAEQFLYDSSDTKLTLSNLSLQFRSEGEGIELLRQQVFRIKCNIGSQMGSPNTKVVCYLVFKLSKSCSGLHCPVIVRDQSNWGSKESGILYFRSPSPWNLVSTDRVPKKRGDGWMEVIVAIFNSDCRFLNLKLITYEGTMSGLIIRNLEFRPK